MWLIKIGTVVDLVDRVENGDMDGNGATEMFNLFLNDQIGHDQALRNSIRDAPEGQPNKIWRNTGTKLKEMADAFEQTTERNVIRVLAESVNLNANRGQFNTLLTELFSDGKFSKEIIVFLFYFCYDVVKRALERKLLELFWKLIDWSMMFMAENLGRWVAQHGGWVAVLGGPQNLLKPPLAAALVICAGIGIGYLLYKTEN